MRDAVVLNCAAAPVLGRFSVRTLESSNVMHDSFKFNQDPAAQQTNKRSFDLIAGDNKKSPLNKEI